ncbi:MAG: PIG-L family deacetylase [candidate division WOR-3 bacterium]|nr:MAG: PIG-L family deacetylase [candidate division WOR-3 bacterium]
MVYRRPLVIAPHTDDGEFGCGGTMARLVEEGAEVHYAALSIAEDSVPAGLPRETLAREVTKATRELGLDERNLIVERIPVRRFPEFRQQILELLVDLNRRIEPDLVLLPCSTDTHQDHQVVSQEGFRAFKKTTLLGYEIPWNNLTFSTNAFVFLEPRHLEAKLRAVRCYVSQLGRKYVDEEFIRSLARTRGVQIGAEYAESFEVARLVLRTGRSTESSQSGTRMSTE